MADVIEEWTCKPFIALDGGDGKGGAPAEVRVTKGVGKVFDLDEGPRSTKVTIKVKDRKYMINGYINSDDPALDIAKDAFDSRTPIQFRLEQQRKPGIDRSKSFHDLITGADGQPSQDLAKANTIKLFVGFGKPDGDIVLSTQHVTLPANDGQSSAGAVAADADNATVVSTGFTPSDNYGDVESKPWIGVNHNGAVNPGSYAVSCMPKMFFMIKRQNPDITDEIAKRTTEELVGIADRMQVQVYGGKNGTLGRANRFYNSHQVARQIILDIIDTEGIPENIGDDNVRTEWEKYIAKRAYQLWRWAIDNYQSVIDASRQ